MNGMRTGSFEAVGWETGSPRSLKFLLLVAGTFQIFLLFPLHQLGGWYAHIAILLVGPSFIILISSTLILAVMSSRYASKRFVKDYVITFSDGRAEGGKLELSYADAKGAKSEHVIVRWVRMSKTGLYRPAWGGARWVEGADAALQVRFENRKGGLDLGFPSREEMERIYRLLSGHA